MKIKLLIIISLLSIYMYRILEHVDGEKGCIKLMSYKKAEKIKVYLYNFI